MPLRSGGAFYVRVRTIGNGQPQPVTGPSPLPLAAGLMIYSMSHERGHSPPRPAPTPLPWLGLLAVAATIRFMAATRGSFNLDEWFTAQMVTGSRGFFDMVANVAAFDAHPPLYYALAWLGSFATGYWSATGYEPGVQLALRLPPLLLGVTGIGLMALLAWRELSPRAALFAASLATLSAVWIQRDSQARMYPLLVVLSLAALLLLLRAVDRNTVTAWSIYALAAALLLYTHYLAVFLLLGHAGYGLLYLRRSGRKLGLALLAVVPFLLWLPVLIRSLAGGRAYADIREPAGLVLDNFWRWLLNPWDRSPLFVGVTLLAWAVLLYGLGHSLARRRLRALVTAALLLPLGGWLVVSATVVNLFSSRYLIVFLPLLLLLLSYGLDRIARASPTSGYGLFALCLAVSGLGTVAHFRAIPTPSWQTIAEAATVQVTDGDAVLSNSQEGTALLGYYLLEPSGTQPFVHTTDDPRTMPAERFESAGSVWYIKEAFAPWDPRNWTAEEEAFFVRWSNDHTDLVRLVPVGRNMVLVELKVQGRDADDPDSLRTDSPVVAETP